MIKKPKPHEFDFKRVVITPAFSINVADVLPGQFYELDVPLDGWNSIGYLERGDMLGVDEKGASYADSPFAVGKYRRNMPPGYLKIFTETSARYVCIMPKRDWIIEGEVRNESPGAILLSDYSYGYCAKHGLFAVDHDAPDQIFSHAPVAYFSVKKSHD